MRLGTIIVSVALLGLVLARGEAWAQLVDSSQLLDSSSLLRRPRPLPTGPAPLLGAGIAGAAGLAAACGAVIARRRHRGK